MPVISMILVAIHEVHGLVAGIGCEDVAGSNPRQSLTGLALFSIKR